MNAPILGLIRRFDPLEVMTVRGYDRLVLSYIRGSDQLDVVTISGFDLPPRCRHAGGAGDRGTISATAGRRQQRAAVTDNAVQPGPLPDPGQQLFVLPRSRRRRRACRPLASPMWTC